MGKKYARGNRKAQRYRSKIRSGRDWIIYAPWGTPLFDGRGGRPLYPPGGWLFYENQYGRGFYKPVSITTPYDKPVSYDQRSRRVPAKYKPYLSLVKAEGHNVVSGKKGSLP